jgi:hypothetical protein
MDSTQISAPYGDDGRIATGMHERIVFTIAAMEPASIGSSPYAVARLIKAHGDLTLTARRAIGGLPRRAARSYTDWCAARFGGNLP